jgi:hypothetical protein
MATTSSKKRANENGGIKTVISALSIAAVVGGWAGYTMQNNQQPDEQTVQYEEPQGDSNQVSLELAPIPTLVTAPNFQTSQAQGAPTAIPTALPNVSVGSASSGGSSGLPNGQVRVVRQPRQPATNTKSSRP